MARRISPALMGVIASIALVAMAVFALAWNAGGRAERGELDTFTGSLVEWSVAGPSRGPLLRFRLEGSRTDFRLDPIYFRDALDRRVPLEFRRGAQVTVTASRSELRNPAAPVFSDEQIVWVRGIDVDGRPVIAPGLIDAADAANDRWGWVLLALAAGAFAYAFAKWNRSRPGSGKSRRRARGR